MPIISEENQRAKMQFIVAFFDDFDKKVSYLEELYRSKHRDEARILSSCYIDKLASALYWPNNKTNLNYVRIFREHSGKEIFSHIHPKMLIEALVKLSESRGGKKWAAIQAKVSDKLRGAGRRLYEEQEIIDELAPVLEPSEVQYIKPQLWRGTFAAIVYDRFRVASVHDFGPLDSTTFDGTTFQGQPIPDIDFFMVHDCLKRIIAVARERSQETGKWFGHDYEK
jgi:hypothetical protein